MTYLVLSKWITLGIFIIFFMIMIFFGDKDDSSESDQIKEVIYYDEEKEIARQVFLAINKYREENNIPTLALNNEITKVAYTHSNYMATINNLNHDDFFKRSDTLRSIGYKRVAENCAQGYTNIDNLIKGWDKSTTHSDLMKNGNFKQIGISVVKSKYNILFYTTIYATKQIIH